MPTCRTPPACPRCQVTYDEFRTGLTFAEVRASLYTGSPDPKDWRQKRRHGVLGTWREIKMAMWWAQHGGCEAQNDGDETEIGK